MSITMLAWGFNGIARLPFGFLADAPRERQTLALMGTLVLAMTVATVPWLAAIYRPGEISLPAASRAPSPALHSDARDEATKDERGNEVGHGSAPAPC